MSSVSKSKEQTKPRVSESNAQHVLSIAERKWVRGANAPQLTTNNSPTPQPFFEGWLFVRPINRCNL